MNSHSGHLSSLSPSRPPFAFSPMRIDPGSDAQRDQDQLHHQVWLSYHYRRWRIGCVINLGLSLNLSLILCHAFNISYVWPLAIAKFPCFDPNSCGFFMVNIIFWKMPGLVCYDFIIFAYDTFLSLTKRTVCMPTSKVPWKSLFVPARNDHLALRSFVTIWTIWIIWNYLNHFESTRFTETRKFLRTSPFLTDLF